MFYVLALTIKLKKVDLLLYHLFILFYFITVTLMGCNRGFHESEFLLHLT